MRTGGDRFSGLGGTHRFRRRHRPLFRDERWLCGHLPVRGLWHGSGCARMKEKFEVAALELVPYRDVGSVADTLERKDIVEYLVVELLA